MKTVD